MKDAIKIFNNYVKKYDLQEIHLMRKFHHSYRVMELSIEIAKSLQLSDEDIKLVSIIGLFHDIGRFKQWTEYKTFCDEKSIDHGDLGEDILKKEILNKLDLDEDIKKIVLIAIKNHNKLKVDDNLTEKQLMMCKIIRDADKLDIMKEQCQPLDKNYEMKKEIMDIFSKHTLIPVNLSSTPLDILSVQLSFAFDLNFTYSFNYVLNNNLILNIINILEIYSNEDLQEVKKDIINYVKEKCLC